MASEYVYRRRIEFSDTDLAGIAHFSRYFCFAEEAEHAFLRSLGASAHVPREGYSIGFPRLGCRFEFQRPLHFEDEVEILLWVRHKGAKSLTYQFQFSTGGSPVAHGEFVVVCCRCYPEGRVEACELPAELDDLLEESQRQPLAFRDKETRKG